MSADLSDLVLPHVDRDDLAERMAGFYAETDQAVADHRPTCWNRGACCRFDAFGHRLFVTTVELAYFVRRYRDEWRRPDDTAPCPYQQAGRCTAREHRPLGCRAFFCDPNAQAWQPGLYEARLAELKRIGAETGVEYRYVEWLSALSELDAGIASGRTPSRSELLETRVRH